jgi:diaminohydroxyphosphoribosylaminopyrimidine deaminase / 5-amino-6-(5-phosphoribosylamino)uracil reductase
MSTLTKNDSYFLKKVLSLAKKASGMTSPNPMVGAVLVKNNKIIATGYHKVCGGPHAEIEAMSKLRKSSLLGASLYINLEPCCHWGKTGPCVSEIIKNKIKRVVICDIDPNPLVKGGAVRKLKKASIKVNVGLLKEKAVKLNEIFYKNMNKKMPFVAAKIAQSLDGKITTASGESRWITTKKSRVLAKQLRDKYDCILVGVNTVIKDNPQLAGLKKIPYRAVVDPNLRIPLASSILRNAPDKTILFVSTKKAKCKKLKKISSQIRVVFIDEEKGVLPVKKILKSLFNNGIMSVYAEGGARSLGEFFDAHLVDKIYFFIAAKIIGGIDSLSSVGASGAKSIKDVINIKEMTFESIGCDIFVSGYPDYRKV